MKNIVTPENLNTVANTISNNGINNTIIASFIIVVLIIISAIISLLFAIIRSNQKTTDKLLASFDDNQKKDREVHIQNFNDSNEHLKCLTNEMKEINQRYSNTISNISSLIEIQTEKVNSAILNDKPQSLRDFDRQSKHIIKALIYESIDFVLEIIARNSLFENKSNISREILMRFKSDLQQGADAIDALPFRDNKIKQNLFLKIELFMNETYDDLLDILNVGKNYDRCCLERSVRSIREDFINRVNSMRYAEL